jgi:hypothetical protein
MDTVVTDMTLRKDPGPHGHDTERIHQLTRSPGPPMRIWR